MFHFKSFPQNRKGAPHGAPLFVPNPAESYGRDIQSSICLSASSLVTP